MKYKFVPISQRKALCWPNGKRLAVMITTNLEYWDMIKDTPKPFYPGGPGIVGGDLPGNVYDNPNWTWREYGQRVGDGRSSTQRSSAAGRSWRITMCKPSCSPIIRSMRARSAT